MNCNSQDADSTERERKEARRVALTDALRMQQKAMAELLGTDLTPAAS